MADFGNFWVFWTGSGSTSLLDMCTASGGSPLGQLSFFQPCLHVILLTWLSVEQTIVYHPSVHVHTSLGGGQDGKPPWRARTKH